MSRETVYVNVPNEQKARWKALANEHDMSQSEFVAGMTEAGLKKFDATVDPDESRTELRKQRNDLKEQLELARDRIESLEDRLHHGERTEIRQYVEDNPGAPFDEIVRHVIDTVPARVSQHLDDLEGDDLVIDPETERYYPTEDNHATSDPS